jgi:molybdate transport system substrate-binding protein
VTWFDRILLPLLSAIMAILFAGGAAAGTEITVSAALSLKVPFEEIGRAYEKKHPGSKVAFNFAASGVLQKQIEAGAPVDVFASASPKEIDSLEGSGLIIIGSRADFAGNTIVLITASKAQVGVSSFGDLKKREIERIAIGNPATVPAGKYSEEALKSLGLWEQVKTKVIYAEHVRQVMDYVARSEVDAGMVFITDAISRSGDLKVVAEAQASSHKPVVYAIAVIKGSKHEAEANSFISMVMSKEGKEALRKHGFIITP